MSVFLNYSSFSVVSQPVGGAAVDPNAAAAGATGAAGAAGAVGAAGAAPGYVLFLCFLISYIVWDLPCVSCEMATIQGVDTEQ